MKTKIAIATAIAMMASVLTGLAQAAGSITISGTVAISSTIAVASQSGYNTLAIATGVTAQTVAIATETSNDKNGYTVTLKTANAPTGTAAILKGATGNTDTVPYTMTYGGTAVTLVAGSAIAVEALVQAESLPAVDGDCKHAVGRDRDAEREIAEVVQRARGGDEAAVGQHGAIGEGAGRRSGSGNWKRGGRGGGSTLRGESQCFGAAGEDQQDRD